MTRAYLDHNATTPLRAQARDAMVAALGDGGNPSSVHAEGRAARGRVEGARRAVADAVGARPDDVAFTSGGTEACNLALASVVRGAGVTRLLVSAVEHDAMRTPAHEAGVTVETIPVTRDGVLDLDALKAQVAAVDGARVGVVVMMANNETGVVQPVAEAAEIAHGAGGVMVVDAVQGLGKLDVDLHGLGADYLCLSAHKIGGPQGAGALVTTPGAPTARVNHGGGQERGRRGGTENVAAIVGFGAAVDAAVAERSAVAGRLGALRDRLEAAARETMPEARVAGAGAERLANTSCLALPGYAAETQVMALDLSGVAVSAGAACSSGKVRPSHVLTAMGWDEKAAGSAVRVSLGWTTTEADIDHFIAAWREGAERFARRRAAALA